MVLLHGSHAEIVHMSSWFWPVMLASLAKLPNVWHEILWLRIAPANPQQTTAFWSALSASFWASGKSSCKKMSQTRSNSLTIRISCAKREVADFDPTSHRGRIPVASVASVASLMSSGSISETLGHLGPMGLWRIPMDSRQACKPPSLQPSQTLLPNPPSDQVTDTKNLSSLHRWKCWNDWHCELENSSWQTYGSNPVILRECGLENGRWGNSWQFYDSAAFASGTCVFAGPKLQGGDVSMAKRDSRCDKAWGTTPVLDVQYMNIIIRLNRNQ